MASKVKVEVFTARPPCGGCVKLLEMADALAEQYGDRVEVVKHIGPCDEFKKYGLTMVPAVVVGEGKVMIMGVCPDLETLKAALKEAGL
ncbi:MAG: thioredoxin family protein [Desulfurococcaceae archaeon]